MADGEQLKWTDVWRLFDEDEQFDACECLIGSFGDDESDDDGTAAGILSRTAEATKFRLAEVQRLARQDPRKLARMLRPRVAAVLREESWARLFRIYYFKRKASMLCAFLDELGIRHNALGGIEGDFDGVALTAAESAVEHLARTFAAREIGRYLAVLCRMDSRWSNLAGARDRLLGVAPRTETPTQGRLEPESGAAVSSSVAEFSILDRVIISEIVRSVMAVEGSLDEQEVQELVATVLRLNENWHRAYFHLGFIDVLMPSRSLEFDRPGDNDQRRSWYMAGVIAGLARSRAGERLKEVVETRAQDFALAAARTDGPGAAIAKVGFRFLVESGRIGEGLKVLREQLRRVGLLLGEQALDLATSFIRQRQYDTARAVVDILREGSFDVDPEDEDQVAQYRLEIDRRLGQCMQAAADFDGAERAFERMLKAGEDRNSPDLLADLGLVKGRFRSVDELALPEPIDRRINMREALTRGEPLFKRALEAFGTRAPKACYAMAVLHYLRWALNSGKEDAKEGRRPAAVEYGKQAVSAIQTSNWEAIYRKNGVLGQTQFMLSVLLMNGYDEMDGRDAVAMWQSITEEAGLLPEPDVMVLLAAAERHGAAVADGLAVSIWAYRRGDALEMLSSGPWISRTPDLRREVLAIARSDATPRSERVRLWTTLIPAFNRDNELNAAVEGLTELEELAQEIEFTEWVLDFISERTNTDPAWSAIEASWARIRLFRRMGADKMCAQELKTLFYQVRDVPYQAAEVMEAFRDWRLDPELEAQLRAALPMQVSHSAPDGAEERLRGGESVRLLFVGGNETQAQYDDQLRTELKNAWPGVTVRFEHTGWSSNWGREVDNIVRYANASDAVVIHRFMRTMLGRTLRERCERPWIPCVATGKGGMLASLRHAAVVGLTQRLKQGQKIEGPAR
jgi:tetratricopeptide (TPR) repeat protein